MNRRNLLKNSVSAAVTLSFINHGVFAQQPSANAPIKLVVAYPPGGSVDTSARILSGPLGAKLGRNIVVDNRPGASGTIGTSQVARAEADGLTLLLASSIELTIQPVFNPKLPYDPMRDLKPVAFVGKLPYVLVVRSESSITSLADLINRGKAAPGKLSYASFGNYSSPHLIGEMLNAKSGIDAVHVPYKGSGPAVIDLLGGQVDFMFDTSVATVPQVAGGKMRALATTASSRLHNAPDIPTVKELGFPDLAIEGWFGLFAPSSTPANILAKYRESAAEVLATKDVQSALLSKSVVPGNALTDAQFSEFMKQEMNKWKELSSRVKISE